MTNTNILAAKHYAKRDPEAQGAHYINHVSAMTSEGLHSKSAIAAELAHRDMEIDRLRAALDAPAQAVPAPGVEAVSEREFKQFMSDLITAAGLVTHGKKCKDLGRRLGEMSMRLLTAPKTAAAPVQALDAARVFWQQHTKSDALSMTMAELHADVELVIRAARGAAQAAPVAWRYHCEGDPVKWHFSDTPSLLGLTQPLYASAQAAPVDAAVQQDAERLDFMIESCTQVATISPSGRKYLCYPDGRMQAGSYPTARAAIDAARAAQKGTND